jgi:hydrogenase maturation factor
MGVCTAYGTVEPENLKTPGSARPRDLILCTKPIGLETVVNFSLTHVAWAKDLFGEQSTARLSKKVQMQSCVREALQLAELKSVHAMHDATEGGLVTALNEVAAASNLGFKMDYESVPLTGEVQILQKAFGLSNDQVLAMSSTGTILAAVSPEGEDEVKEILNRLGLEAYFLGQFTDDGKKSLIQNNQEQSFPKVADDPYTRILFLESKQSQQ